MKKHGHKLPRRSSLFRPRLECLEERAVPAVGWSGFGGNAQHTAPAPAPAQSLDVIHWQTPVDLAPQYSSGGDLLIHYGEPAVTPANTILVPVKTGATDGFEIKAFNGASGSSMWTVTSDYILPKNPDGTVAYDWTPEYSPVLTSAITWPGETAPTARLYFAGAGGTVWYIENPDGSATPTATRLAFYGLSNYNANPAGYNGSVFIDTPLTAGPDGSIYFGYRVTGSNPSNLVSGIARIAPDGTGTFVSAQAAASEANAMEVPHGAAPALSNDGKTLYVDVRAASTEYYGYLLALDSTTLATKAKAGVLKDPRNNGNNAGLLDDSTASPLVGPDGDVYLGVMGNPYNGSRGFMLHFDSNLNAKGAPGAFGWDDTDSIVPASMVPGYTGTSSYLLFTKYNNYANVTNGGDGVNKIAILDPNATQVDTRNDGVSNFSVMKEVLTIAGPTPDNQGPSFPNAVREWCINSCVVDPASDSVYANSEDGKLYRWNLATNTLSQSVTLTSGVGEAYTPTWMGPDGTVYAINNATLFAVGQRPATATFVTTDATTKGNWQGTYGTQGYNVIDAGVSYPSYAQVTPSGNADWVWAASTSDPRALLKPGSTTDRIAATWYSPTSFTVDVNVTGGQLHQVGLYLLDYDSQGRSERVDVLDALSGNVLDTRTVTSFSGGKYLTWNVGGHVQFKLTNLSGPNAVLSGLFFDPPGTPPAPTGSASFVGTDITTVGSWKGVYGSEGYNVIDGGPAVYPAYATVGATGNSDYVWAGSTQDVRALQKPGSTTDRIAAAWYAGSSFTVDVNLTGGAHQVAFYLLDWDNQGRTEKVDVVDFGTGTVLDSRTASGFNGGQYWTWNLTGHVQLRFTNAAGPNAVLSGIFFGATGNPPPPPAPSATAVFVRTDTTTQGSWVGAYGSQGYNVVDAGVSYPAYATVGVAGQQDWIWAASTNDVRALQNPNGGRIASTWYSPTTFTIDLNLTDGAQHQIALYLLDFDNQGRSERVDVVDSGTGVVLNSQTAGNFGGGEYLVWNISGHVQIRVTDLAGPNAVVSGLFFA
jgi:hypothetical protein